MADIDHTQHLHLVNETVSFEARVRTILAQVAEALAEKGYNPLEQLVGYLLSGDPAFITTHKQARTLVQQVGREELLEELVRHYVKDAT